MHTTNEKDWIDREKERRDKGVTRALTQSQHRAVNERYPGCTRQECVDCEAYTGRTRRDALHIEEASGDLHGPLCKDCWDSYCEQDGYKDPLE